MNKSDTKSMSAAAVDELNIATQEKERKLETLQRKITRLESFAAGIGLITCPFRYDGKDNVSLVSNKFGLSWNKYKYTMMDEWHSPVDGKRVITPEIGGILYFIGYIIAIVFGIYGISTKLHTKFGINFFSFAAAIWFIYELFVGIVSIYHYVVRPNRINKRKAKAEIKALKKQEKILLNEISINKNIMESYRLSQINPMEQFNSIKTRGINELYDIIGVTESDIIPNISEGYKKTYTVTLEKCRKLLKLAEDDGRIVTEISKIYVIYMNDINNLLIRVSRSDDYMVRDTVEIMEMLRNFDNFVDRKIKKFSNVSNMLISSEIGALNTAFSEE